MAPQPAVLKSPVPSGRVSPESRVSRRSSEDFAVGGVRRATPETDEPVEVGRQGFCKTLNDGKTLLFLTAEL